MKELQKPGGLQLISLQSFLVEMVNKKNLKKDIFIRAIRFNTERKATKI